MKFSVEIKGRTYQSDLDTAHDLSIHVNADTGPRAWYVEPIKVTPVVMGNYVGAIKHGSPVNFMNVFFNPHGHGTHTECMEHIADKGLSICDVVPNHFLVSKLLTVTPTLVEADNDLSKKGDLVVMPDDLNVQNLEDAKALIVRTLPNSSEKKDRVYSETNPCYFHPHTIQKIIDSGIDHLLIDLPSVDKEDDGGKVLSHHTFWEYPKNPQLHRTITELIFASNEVMDGLYLLNLQVAPFKMDAAPSRPIIYPLD